MQSDTCTIAADFLHHPARELFHVLLRPAERPAHGAILLLHPFAEEMNKSRRNVAAQARALAASGYNVMLLDLTGCGDSAGDFADASWRVWLEDASFALDALQAIEPLPLQLWGLRLGALLAVDLCRLRADIAQLLLWQPVLNGEQQIDQFLRLRTAAAISGGRVGFDRKGLWQQLREGNALEVAGYTLSATLALELAGLRLYDLSPHCPVKWLELALADGGELSRPVRNVVQQWRRQGVSVDVRTVPGEPFWRNQDAALNPELQAATADMLSL